jgi:hypothetical protein
VTICEKQVANQKYSQNAKTQNASKDEIVGEEINERICRLTHQQH